MFCYNLFKKICQRSVEMSPNHVIELLIKSYIKINMKEIYFCCFVIADLKTFESRIET